MSHVNPFSSERSRKEPAESCAGYAADKVVKEKEAGGAKELAKVGLEEEAGDGDPKAPVNRRGTIA